MKLYLKYFKMNLCLQMQYKTSFILTIIGQFLTSFSVFLEIYFMMNRFYSVSGFSYEEVLLCFAIVLLVFSLAECFARGFDTFPTMITNGEFDRILLRPRNEVFQILATKMEFSRVGRLIQAVIIFVYSFNKIGINWHFEQILLLCLMVISGTVIFSGLFIIYAAICFYTLEELEFMNIFTDGGREFGKYPFSIYGKSVLKLFTFVIPLALFQYYPFLYSTSRSHNIIYMLAPLIGLLFIIPCLILWKIGLKRYSSTGS